MRSPIVHEPHQKPKRVRVRMQDVNSRSIRRVGYNPDTRQLVVQFYDSLPGKRTVYSPVPQEVYEEFMQAPSMGRYLGDNIRYTYDFNLVNEEDLVDPDSAEATEEEGSTS